MKKKEQTYKQQMKDYLKRLELDIQFVTNSLKQNEISVDYYRRRVTHCKEQLKNLLETVASTKETISKT